jgi:hypothetical protein
MNIAIGKIGKSILFSHKKWGLIGGDAAPSILYTGLASMNPDITFYIIGKSDFSTLSETEKERLVPNNNIIDTWSDKEIDRGSGVWVERDVPYNFVKRNKVKIDAAVLFAGPCGNVNMKDLILTVATKNNPKRFIAKPLEMFEKYAGPIIHFLNMSMTPHFMIVEDPRYIPLKTRDLWNPERLYLSQYETVCQPIKRINNYEEQKIIAPRIPVTYNGVETIFLMGEEREDFRSWKKDNKMLIIMNGSVSSGGMDRYPEIKSYVLDQFPETNIYGAEWSEELYATDSRFKKVRMANILDEVKATKYTLIIPIKNKWVTSKFWKMATFGILPFMHPTYDTQKHIKCSEFLRVKSAEDFKNKIEYLEANPDKYKLLLNELYLMLKDEYYDGRYINNVIMENVYKLLNKPWKYSNIKNQLKISEFQMKHEQDKKDKKLKKFFTM